MSMNRCCCSYDLIEAANGTRMDINAKSRGFGIRTTVHRYNDQ